MTEEYDGFAGILLAGDIGKRAAIDDKISPAVLLAEIAEVIVGRDGLAVTDMILRKNGIAVLAELLCKAGVTLAVLRHAVGYLEYSLDAVLIRGRPAARVDIAKTSCGFK